MNPTSIHISGGLHDKGVALGTVSPPLRLQPAEITTLCGRQSAGHRTMRRPGAWPFPGLHSAQWQHCGRGELRGVYSGGSTPLGVQMVTAWLLRPALGWESSALGSDRARSAAGFRA